MLQRSFYGAVNDFLSAENMLQRYFDGAVDDFSQMKTCSDGNCMVPQMVFLKGKRALKVLLWWREWFFSKKIVLLLYFYGAVNYFCRKKMCSDDYFMVP